MSFTQTFVGKVLLYVDVLACSIVRRDPGMTISTACDMALSEPKPGVGQACLRALGRALNWLLPGHTRASAWGDHSRAELTEVTLWNYLDRVGK